jgi:hypothetical protein
MLCASGAVESGVGWIGEQLRPAATKVRRGAASSGDGGPRAGGGDNGAGEGEE